MGPKATSVLKQFKEVWSPFTELRAPIEEALRTKCGRALLAEEYRKEVPGFLPATDALWSATVACDADLEPAGNS